MIYDVTGNSLLSAQAAGLDAPSLALYGAIAENLLGLDTIPKFADAGSIATATGAVALQVNRLLEVGGSDLLKSWSQGARSEVFRDGVSLLSRLAQIAVQSITGAPTTTTGGYEALTSSRGSKNYPDIVEGGYFPFTPY